MLVQIALILASAWGVGYGILLCAVANKYLWTIGAMLALIGYTFGVHFIAEYLGLHWISVFNGWLMFIIIILSAILSADRSAAWYPLPDYLIYSITSVVVTGVMCATKGDFTNGAPTAFIFLIFALFIALAVYMDRPTSTVAVLERAAKCNTTVTPPTDSSTISIPTSGTVGELFCRPNSDKRGICAGGHYYIPKDVQLWKKGTCRYDAEELSQKRAMYGDFTPGFYDDWKWMITLDGRDVTYEGIDKSLLKPGAKIYCHESLVETFNECGFRAIAH